MYLNQYMGEKKHNSISFIDSKRIDFQKVIKFIFDNLGIVAFRNLATENTYQTRFNPTIFDSISIATSYAMEKLGDNIPIEDIKNRHKILLLNDKFKEYSTIRTTNIDHINGRIQLASQILYGISYE